MLKNFWYVAGESSDVTNKKPRKAKLLGQDIVLFRDQEGRAVALSDVCVHRGASLAGGKVQKGCVECPYHGWQFGESGACRRIPAHEENPIPKKARVDSYPVQERYGWVWVFMGDLPEAQRPPLPEFPEYNDAGYRCIHGQFLWQASAARVVENGLDFAHAAYVHDGQFGDSRRPHIGDFDVHQHAWGADAALTWEVDPPGGLWRVLRPSRAPVMGNPGFHLSGNVMHLKVQLSPRFRQVIFDANTPIDEHTTLTYWIFARDFFRPAIFDDMARRRMQVIFEQDARVLAEIQPEQLPYDLSEEVSVRSDALQIAFRRMRQHYIDLGYKIDTQAIATHYKNRRAVVVPSPARRDPAIHPASWVIDEVPTVEEAALRRPKFLKSAVAE